MQEYIKTLQEVFAKKVDKKLTLVLEPCGILFDLLDPLVGNVNMKDNLIH